MAGFKRGVKGQSRRMCPLLPVLITSPAIFLSVLISLLVVHTLSL